MEDVLIVDCQTTGAFRAGGRLLELAWCRASAPADGASCLVALPDGVRLPRKVTALTGIGPRDLADAVPPAEAWRRLWAAAATLARTDAGAVLAVAHFARFELPFLLALHRDHGGGGPFPFELLCTHEIARRTLPALPRRTLRALAGYFGHPAATQKRAAAHVGATAVVWRELLERLAAAHDVGSLPALRAWLRAPAPRRPARREVPLAREKRLALPDAPGVYRMRGRAGQVLYVGKATSLKRRVNSYFHRRPDRTEQVLELVTQTFELDVTETGTVLEAALLEVEEIQAHAPPYNTALKTRDSAGVWFAAPDLASWRPEADDRHRVGPVPSRELLEALRQLRALLDEPCPARLPEALCGRVLGLPEGIVVDAGCFHGGLERFRVTHGLGAGASAARLARLGARLWRDERRCAAESADAAEPPERPHGWTPERVATTLEALVLRGAHLVRRAHWLAALADACVAWAPAAAGGSARRRLLVLDNGRVADRADLPPGAELPPPPGARRPALERLRAFDARTHDRLRVLTTELKRELAEGARLELRLGPRACLDGAALARRLYWV